MVSATATAKKTPAPKKPRSHPPYAEMISEAISVLKERTGSSQVAIGKFIEEKQKDLPSNFRKLLLVQLKKLVATGKLTKIKGSFKLSPVAIAKPKKEPATKKKATAAANTKAVTPKKNAKSVAKKVVTAPGKVKKATPVKKATVAKVKKTTPARKVKSIKSPVKKVVKKAKK